MKRHWQNLGLISMIALAVLLGAASGVLAQTPEPNFFGRVTPQDPTAKVAHPAVVLNCKGSTVKAITDVAFEGFLFTPTAFAPGSGGGEGGCFAPTPVLSTTVTIPTGFTCLNAHFSAILGSQQTYGPALNRLGIFQVTLTRLVVPPTPPQHMIGHYETPYGLPCPAIGIEAERDVDTFGANFFQRFGTTTQPGDLPPGNYRVDVWWAGGPPPPFGAGGVFAGALVLKLYGG
jgi:hypothetical protein